VFFLIIGRTNSLGNKTVTDADASEGWKRFRLLPVIMALTCVFLWGAMFARIADRGIGIDKDWLFLYLCGVEFVQPQLHEQQIDLVKKIVAASGDDQVVFRATARANYCNNYPFTSLSMYFAGTWQTYFGVTAAQDFPTFFNRSLWSGIIVSGGLLGILCLVVAFAATAGPLRFSLFAAVGFCALYFLTIPPLKSAWMFYQATPVPPGRLVNWPNILGVGLYSWINPGIPYSPFSVFPRCLCGMLAFAAFAIRWSGRPGAAYWVPLLVSGVHQSTALMLLFALACCDLVIRPQVFTRVSILLPIGVTLLIIILRERIFSMLGFSLLGGVTIAAVLLCVALVLAMLRRVRSAVQTGWSFIAAWRARTIEAVPLPFADALVIFAAWLGLILISYLAARNDAWFRVIYFWSELSPRYVGLFQLSVFAGLLYPLVVMVRSARPKTERAVTMAVTFVMLIMAASQLPQERKGYAFQKMRAQPYDEETTGPKDVYAGSTTPSMKDETSWYYLLVRDAILGENGLSAFFGKTKT
jgi:hypothetical protein